MAYPGNQHGYEHLKPALQQLLQQWPWTPEQRQQIILRSDAEQGTDANIAYILWLGFQVLMKGYSGRRTQAWVKQIAPQDWQVHPSDADRWAAPAPIHPRLGRRIAAYVLRWRKTPETLNHATLWSTLDGPIFAQWQLYDGRGAMEMEIRADKSGLGLTQRRKQSLNAAEAWLVLTDVAHNLLAWLEPWMLAGSRFEGFGPQRIVRDLLTIPGSITFEDGRLHKVALLATHPYAAEMRACLHKLLITFDLA